MNSKGKIITVLLCLIIFGLYFVSEFYTNNISVATKAYQVYLNGESLGLIENKDKLYELINEQQLEIKDKYNVNYVYPPNGLDIVEVNTYNSSSLINIHDIYTKIENIDDYTIKGYIITIKPQEGDKITINVLDKKVFEEALKKFVFAFVKEEDYEKYINNSFGTLSDIGQVIEDMYFSESITIKEGYISVKDNIFTDVETLSQYILFGPDAKMDSYTVALGDDIESISEKYDLNPEEFIVANPDYRDVNTMLRVGDQVNVTLLNPILSYNYKVYEIAEKEIAYSDNKKVDTSKPSSYKEISVQGVTGIDRIHETYSVTNGEQNNDVQITNTETIRAKVDQVTITGKKTPVWSTAGTYVDIGGEWGWPTNSPYVITSKYGMRKGKLHSGVDISGTGYGSPIYAIGDGVVVQTRKAVKKGEPRWSNGTYVVISHGDNLYSGYLHLDSYLVTVGQVVKKGQQIGRMGESGQATGPHLHLGLYRGEPFANKESSPLNALATIYKQ